MALYTREPVYTRTYSEREYLMNDRFEPGEFGKIAALALASLLLFGLAMWGLGNFEAMEYPTMFGHLEPAPYGSTLTPIPDSSIVDPSGSTPGTVTDPTLTTPIGPTGPDSTSQPPSSF
jgi:hypothetical protein